MSLPDPVNAASLLTAAKQAYQTQNRQAAESLARQVLEQAPDHIDALNLLGSLCAQSGRRDEACRLLSRAVSLAPARFEAHANLGNVLHDAGQPEAALASLDRALALAPRNADILSLRAPVLHDLGRYEDALACYTLAIEGRPGDAELHMRQGMALCALARFLPGLDSFSAALRLAPDDAVCLLHRGNALFELARVDEALQDYQHALDIKPDDVEILHRLALALLNRRQVSAALDCFERALRIAPQSANLLSDRSLALNELGRHDDALHSYTQAIAADPRHVMARVNRGLLLGDLRRPREAVQNFESAVAALPDEAQLHWNLGLCLLRLGDYSEGWREHEWRWRMDSFAALRRTGPQPQWTGAQSLRGKTLLLHGEQGFGDTLQFCRYAGMVKAHGARVILETRAPLAALLASLDGVDQLVVQGSALPAFDYHCPLMSLPLACGTTLASVPAPMPYLRAAPERVQHWQTRLGMRKRPRIGLAWRGSPAQSDDRRRSMALALLLPLLGSDIEWICLQKDVQEEDRVLLASRADLRQFGDEIQDFADTAAIIEQLDLVISVCTSVAHLAGAMAKPVWLLLSYNPCWRWLTDRDDNPWYPTARLFRQTVAGEWTDVIDAARDALHGQFPAVQPAPLLPQTPAPSSGIPGDAKAAFTAGDWPTAERLYRHMLGDNPRSLEALTHLGIIAAHSQRAAQAVEWLSQAAAIAPDSAAVQGNLGNALHDLKRFDEALACFDRSLQLVADNAQALFYRGLVLRDLNRHDEALASYQRAIGLQPNDAEFHLHHAATLQQQKRLDEALAGLDRALHLNPHYTEALERKGGVLSQLGRHEEALACYDTAAALSPDNASVHFARSNVLGLLMRYEEALAAANCALRVDPRYVDALNNRGNALGQLQRYPEAIASLDEALRIDPAFADTHNNRGVLFCVMQRREEAYASFHQAVALNPDHGEALWNLAPLYLQEGDYARGWAHYEYRWRDKSQATPRRSFAQPLWLGREPLAGRTILLHSEQGFGDTLHFCRYARHVAELGARVILEVQPPLLPLLAGLEGTAAVVPIGAPLPTFDCHCPLLSLGLAFNTAEDSIPANIPYLHSDPARVDLWRTRLDRLPGRGKPRVGLVWSGNPGHKNDHNRSLPLASLLPLLLPLRIPLQWVSLNKEVREGDRALLASRRDIYDAGPAIGDFADTAALVELMDLVITVDTSIAHLAGAMGKPVWIMLPFSPDWRWLLGRSDSPWYPTARLFRQPVVGDWEHTLEAVGHALRERWAMPVAASQSTITVAPVPSQPLVAAKAALAAQDWPTVETLCRQALDEQPADADALSLLGIALAQSQRTGQAIEVLSQATHAAPRRADIHGNLGTVLRDAGRFPEALACFDRVLAIKPDDVQALRYRGLVLDDLGRHAEALACFGEALQHLPEDADLLYAEGAALQALQRHEEALARFTRAVALEPGHILALERQGALLVTLGQWRQALDTCNRLLLLRPHDPAALIQRGVVRLALKQATAALQDFDTACQARPADAHAHLGRATALQVLDRHEEALAASGRAIDLAPADAQAYCIHGAILADMNRGAEALNWANQALALASDCADAHCVVGRALLQMAQPRDALLAFERTLAIAPRNVRALLNRGALLVEGHRNEEALDCFERAVAIAPDNAEVLGNSAELLRMLHRPDDALRRVEQALAIDPQMAASHNRKGLALHDLKRDEEALDSYERAIALKPDYGEAFNNRGVTLAALGRYQDALTSYDRAFEFEPDNASVLANRGVVLADLLQYQDAIACLWRALEVKPGNAHAAWNLALCELRCGNFADGWKHFELRWDVTHMAKVRREFSQPLWLGDTPLAGKTILLHYEAGLGDTLQFCRYAPLVKALGATVVMEVQAPLMNLLASLHGVDRLVPKDAPLPPFDIHCPLMSLPLAFCTDEETIPPDVPYLCSDPQKVAMWERHLGPKTGLRVGLAWSGNPEHGNDHNRSIALQQLLPLLNDEVEWICLQKDVRPGEQTLLADHTEVVYCGPLLQDFTDTAAVVELLDLVITVDTSVAHLAGAMAKPLWLLLPHNPDWRWLQGREDSPWYPTARLFRQTLAGDWNEVITRVQVALAERLREAQAGRPQPDRPPALDKPGKSARWPWLLIAAAIAGAVTLTVLVFAR